MITEQDLITALEWEYPGTKDTVDFCVGTQTELDNGVRVPVELQAPGIWAWSLDEPEPTPEELKDILPRWRNSPDYDRHMAKVVRKERSLRLSRVDQLVAKPLLWDSLTPEQKDSVKGYRQQLLDITLDAEFPTNVTWPDVPAIINEHTN